MKKCSRRQQQNLFHIALSMTRMAFDELTAACVRFGRQSYSEQRQGLLAGNSMVMKQLLVLCFLFIGLGAQANDYKLTFTEQQVQQQVNTQLPIDKDLGLAQLKVRKAWVKFLPGDRPLQLSCDVLINSFQYQGNAMVVLTGDLRYHAKNGSFYIDHVHVKDMQVEGMPDSLQPTLKSITQQVLAQTLAQNPIYTLSNGVMEEQLLKANLKTVAVEEGQLAIYLAM